MSQPPQPPHSSTQFPAAKWIQNDNDDSDSDQVGLRWAASDSQFGGNKLRAPKTLAEETEFLNGGKKRTIVKRKRKRVEDGISDEEEDPYTLINIEDILSPIELPTDIVRRPALRRILLSTQIDALAKTSMEFIEGEKNFNKILCRLSAIMHQDDPRYLDLTFDRTVEQRQKYKEDVEAANAAASALTAAATGETNNVVDALDPKELDHEIEVKIKERVSATSAAAEDNVDDNEDHDMNQDDEEEKPEDKEENDSVQPPQQEQDHDMDADVEAREVVKRVKELLLENINYSNEYISRLQGARNKLCKASMQKDTLWKELKANAKEEDVRNKATPAYHH
ncbi:hypothetical protein HMPREF1544_05756 [Mucor circinelloides 1006PhL]|uniref:Transcriptional regulatory protein RXT2 N-terminal domain-containing protein n=1 Tax=Mucor circinelloides f. circinelloides (strain 1006PhL) TaxID=1220926 RepID=S2JB97_MUCC1|nr:hypothetical protein HMPREF1544_05756 [Mucor circinelloides 1006PhL]KAG1108557.1 hypothetical protein G6F42_015945 [Rhizopus arrhizus]